MWGTEGSLCPSLGARQSLGATDSDREALETLLRLMETPLPQLSGTWYVKAVTTNMDKPERKPDSVGPITIVTQDGGNLEVSLSFL